MIYKGDDEVVVALEGTIPANRIYMGDALRHRALTSTSSADTGPDADGFYTACQYIHSHEFHLDNIGNVVMDEFPEIVKLRFDIHSDQMPSNYLNIVLTSQTGGPSFYFNTKTGAIHKYGSSDEYIANYTQYDWASYTDENTIEIDIAGWVTAKNAGEYLPYSLGIKQINASCGAVRFKLASEQ